MLLEAPGCVDGLLNRFRRLREVCFVYVQGVWADKLTFRCSERKEAA